MTNLGDQPILSSDILFGASAIAEFLFGDIGERRRVYNLLAADSLPHFKLGAQLCARKSKLLEWISAQENSGVYFAELEGSLSLPLVSKGRA